LLFVETEREREGGVRGREGERGSERGGGEGNGEGEMRWTNSRNTTFSTQTTFIPLLLPA